MSLMSCQREGQVALVTMDNGENRFNMDFCEELLAKLADIEADKEFKSVILATADPKNWSLGMDLNWLGGLMNAGDMATIKKFLYRVNDVFKAILTFPKPVIAAIGGHSFGDGTIMACACDFRLMRADKGFFCFPEVDINIPFLPGMFATIRTAINEQWMRYMMLTGKRCTAQELAEQLVLVKASDDADQLMADALEFANTFDKKPSTFGEIKRRMNKAALDAIDNEDPAYLENLKILY